MASLARIFVRAAGDGNRGTAAKTAQTARLRRHSGLDPEPCRHSGLDPEPWEALARMITGEAVAQYPAQGHPGSRLGGRDDGRRCSHGLPNRSPIGAQANQKRGIVETLCTASPAMATRQWPRPRTHKTAQAGFPLGGGNDGRKKVRWHSAVMPPALHHEKNIAQKP